MASCHNHAAQATPPIKRWVRGYGKDAIPSFLLAELLCLLLNERSVVEVVDLHCAAHLVHCLSGSLARSLRTLAQDVVDFGDILLVLGATLADRLEHLVEHVVEELLRCAVADTATHVVVLQLLECLVLGPELGEVVGRAERLKVCEHGVAFEVARLVHAHARCTVRHLLHLLPHLSSRVREVDAVAERLRHLLLAVGAGQATCRSVLGQHDLRLHEHLAVCLVEAAHELACHLNHRFLVFACRHGCSLEQSDVGSLAHRVAEEAERNVSLEVAHLYFGLHGRVALHARHGDEVHQICSKLGELRYLTLYEERTLLGVETSREVVESHLDDVLANFFGVVCIVGESLHVSHEDEHTVEIASVLQFDAAAERANVVTQVELTCWTVARKNYLSHILFIFISCLFLFPINLQRYIIYRNWANSLRFITTIGVVFSYSGFIHMQSYKTLITKRYFGRIKVRHIASASVDADVCVGRYGRLRRSVRTSASVDADVCVGRCGRLHRSIRTEKHVVFVCKTQKSTIKVLCLHNYIYICI